MFEQNLEKSLFSQDKEKTYIDKILSKEDIKRILELQRKERLTRSELLELLYLCLGAESKLLNLGTWDRYLSLKFFVWLREFIKVAEIMYDHKENLKKKKKKLSKESTRILDNNERLIEHNAKFLIDLYLNMLRTTLSLGATGFLELLKAKFEIDYKQPIGTQAQDRTTPRWSLKGG